MKALPQLFDALICAKSFRTGCHKFSIKQMSEESYQTVDGNVVFAMCYDRDNYIEKFPAWSELPETQKAVVVMHEIIHAILAYGNHPLNNDEQFVHMMANSLTHSLASLSC